MRSIWTKAQMESILTQLNNEFYPFKKYRFSKTETGMILLGSGGFANIYEMESVNNPKSKYAVKVIGFGDKHVNSEEFKKTVQLQRDLGLFEQAVVQILDFVELRVSIAGECQVEHIVKLSSENTEKPDGNFLDLQFVLMEKLVPVLTTDNTGKPKLFPKALAAFDEKEIMKFAHDIGRSLERAHRKNLLHRDIKLENVFYDTKKKVYKLGDFGIAKITDDGMASTVAFTKGYGAPEVVGAIDERYDNTADIYSYGIMLYVLLNEIRFPDSENYNVNVNLQYSKGYQFPKQAHDDYGLSKIVSKLCQYDPDERYQSMETVLNDIEGIVIGKGLRSKKANRGATYIVAIAFYVFGVILWKLTHMPDLSLDIGIWGYLFLAGGGFIYWQNMKRKEHIIASILVIVLGAVEVFTSGFVWWKLLIVLGIAFSDGSFAGLASGGILIIDIIGKFIGKYPDVYERMHPYNWLAILLLSFAWVLFHQRALLKDRSIRANHHFFKGNRFWIIRIATYTMFAILGFTYRYMGYREYFDWPLMDRVASFLDSHNVFFIGIGGIVLCLIWMLREYFVKKMQELKENER